MSRKSINIDELFERIKNIWATTKDIQAIGGVGYNKALEVKKEIRNQMIDDGWTFPRDKVAMEYVMKYYKLDKTKLSELQRLASLGGVASGK